jgi:hypothetical protein
VDEDSEKGELAWQHRTNRQREAPYHETRTLCLQGGARSAISWNSNNAQDDALVQDEYEERHHCSYCPWFDHISTHCKMPHFLCSTQTSGWCRVPCHHCYFINQMPDTCPYGRRCKHANGHYLTRQQTVWTLSLQEQQIEYDHLECYRPLDPGTSPPRSTGISVMRTTRWSWMTRSSGKIGLVLFVYASPDVDGLHESPCDSALMYVTRSPVSSCSVPCAPYPVPCTL